MYTYRPVQASPSGEVSTQKTPHNAIGVYDDTRMVALYLHIPSFAQRLRTFVVFAALFALCTCLMLWSMVSVTGVLAFAPIIIYTGVVGLVFWSITMPQVTAIEDADNILTAVTETHSPGLDIITSNGVLLSKYPPKEII
jgi:hypothetical protein